MKAVLTLFVLSLAPAAFAAPLAESPAIPSVIAPSLAEDALREPANRLRVWVFFTDRRIKSKAELDRRIAARTAEFPERTLRRRALRGTNAELVNVSDLALADDYVADVLAAGATLRRESRWLNAVSVETTGAAISAIAELPFVQRIQPVAHAVPREPVVEKSSEPSGSSRGSGAEWYGPSFDQLQQIGVVAAHNAGYTGQGVIVGILDTGFNRTHEAFNQSTGGAHPVQIIDEYDYVTDDNDTTQQPGDLDGQSGHGTLVLGVLAANYPGVCVGGAFDASYILAKTEDVSQEVPAEEDNYAAALEWMEFLGADVSTSSLAYDNWYTQADFDGATAVTTLAVNAAIANGLVCCTAAGNTGHDANPATSSMAAPADAMKVLTCGAVDAAGAIASFSSSGPTADGRVKPELLARGIEVQTTQFDSDSGISGFPGTSFATPLIASGAALMVQAHPDWNADKVRRAMFQTAHGFLAYSTFDPLYVRGYGIIDVYAAIQFVHGDIDGDGHADGRDVEPFMAALLGTNVDAAQCRRADADCSGVVSVVDVGVFVGDLLGA
ncbi:MAG: S8 family serine peptidase [Phycisphaerales bacterium]|nr:S8 family serine peptidase [Phycisphaerales bacterium]MCB9855415.1 S8 family serine peptidase [Phycisphaerales bacterium]